jgi:aminopeptidase N
MFLLGLALAAPLTPDPRGAVAPDRSFDMEKLRLDLALDPTARTVSGTAAWTVRRLSPGPLVLNQVAITIEAVRIDGADVAWHTRGDTVEIDVPGQGGVVTVKYTATPRDGLHFRGAGPADTYPEVWSQGEGEDNRYWFPSWDYPNDRFVYEGAITAPAGWHVVTNSGHDMVNYLVMVAAAPYTLHKVGDNEVWTAPDTTEAAVRRVLDPVPHMMKHFAERTGVAYPWGSYRQIFVQRFLYSGMENTSATIQDRWMVTGPSTEGTRRLSSQSVVAHELAHQWYGDLLTCHTWRDLWLNEGFATYFAADWQATVEGPEHWAAGVRGRYRASTAREALVGRFHNGGEQHNVYNKGASVLQMLRVMLGEDGFWRGIRRYTTTHQRALVETDDLRRAFETETGQELGWFFQQWTELPFVPTLTVSHTWDGALVVDVKQDTTDDIPAYTLPIEIEIVRGNERVTRTAWMTGSHLALTVPLSGPPDYVAFDPRGGLLATVDQTQDPKAWEAQLVSGSAYARVVAIEALGRTNEQGALTKLATDKGAALSLRVAAVRALGDQRATASLLPLVADPDETVRDAVLGALGSGVGVEAVPALVAAIERDPNPDIVGTALTALARLAPPEAVKRARTRIQVRTPDAMRAMEAAANVLGTHGEVKDIAALLAVRGPERARPKAVRAAATIAKRQTVDREKISAPVARAAEGLLEDVDLRTREAAVSVLADIGDAQSVSRLEQFRRQETARSLADSANDAITAIRARATPTATPNEVEARLEALERRLGELSKEEGR